MATIDRRHRRAPSPSREKFVNTVRGTTLPEISFDFASADDDEPRAFSPFGGEVPRSAPQSESSRLTSSSCAGRSTRRLSKSQSVSAAGGGDGYNFSDSESHSSVLTDEEAQVTSNENGTERIIREVHYQKESETHKEELLAEIVAEERRCQETQELSKKVKKLLPEPKDTAVQEKSSCARENKGNNLMPESLIEDAEKCFDEFLSNIESMDISSFDGEKSDASSSTGVRESGEKGTAEFSTRSKSCPVDVDIDGVVLPWLQWETNHDLSPSLFKNKAAEPLILEDNPCGSTQGDGTCYGGSNFLPQTQPISCSGGGRRSIFPLDGVDNGCVDHGKYHCQSPSRGHKKLYFDVEEYPQDGQNEEIIFEAWRQRAGISSGALLLCNRTCLPH